MLGKGKIFHSQPWCFYFENPLQWTDFSVEWFSIYGLLCIMLKFYTNGQKFDLMEITL